MDDPMNDSEWKVWGAQFDGSPTIMWTEIYGDGVYLMRRIVYFSLRKALVLSRSRSGACDTSVCFTIDDLLREPYITDEIRSYIAQLQN